MLCIIGFKKNQKIVIKQFYYERREEKSKILELANGVYPGIVTFEDKQDGTICCTSDNPNSFYELKLRGRLPGVPTNSIKADVNGLTVIAPAKYWRNSDRRHTFHVVDWSKDIQMIGVNRLDNYPFRDSLKNPEMMLESTRSGCDKIVTINTKPASDYLDYDYLMEDGEIVTTFPLAYSASRVIFVENYFPRIDSPDYGLTYKKIDYNDPDYYHIPKADHHDLNGIMVINQ